MDDVARQLVRALRGSRSQVGFSRRLGYTSNVAAKWERGLRFPTFGQVLRGAARLGVDVPSVIVRFHRPAAAAFDPSRPEEIHPWLQALVGPVPHGDLALRSGLSRFQVGRLLRGDAAGRLPEVLALVEGATGRVVDLIALLVDVDRVPALRDRVASRQATIRWATEHRWGPAVLAVLDTLPEGSSRAEAVHWLTDRLPVDADHAERELDAAIAAGAVRDDGVIALERRESLVPPQLERDLRAIRHHWATVVADRALDPGPDDLVSFNAFSVAREDLARIQELQRGFFREVRSIVAASAPSEEAALLLVATVPWRPR